MLSTGLWLVKTVLQDSVVEITSLSDFFDDTGKGEVLLSRKISKSVFRLLKNFFVAWKQFETIELKLNSWVIFIYQIIVYNIYSDANLSSMLPFCFNKNIFLAYCLRSLDVFFLSP